MITVAEINIAPVKSMALVPLQSVNLELGGILDDRHFYLVNGQGRLLTRRQVGKLAQLTASWNAEAERLGIRFPDGAALESSPELDAPAWTIVWGRRVRGRALLGDWADALSEFCGQPVKLMMSDLPCQVFDEFPVSILSRASVERLSSEMGMSDDDCLATDRFRPTLLLDGCQPHQEDGWMNRTLTLGDAVIRVLAPDPRCAIVNQDPITGETDTDAVKSILGYRPNALAAYFGVYGIVEKAGAVRVGDAVTPA
ncbi:MAG: MOSC domain-containing protein [Chloroflexi bacterium]|nr:MOSC domain-containing protein [Chloroflexota bacterium]